MSYFELIVYRWKLKRIGNDLRRVAVKTSDIYRSGDSQKIMRHLMSPPADLSSQFAERLFTHSKTNASISKVWERNQFADSEAQELMKKLLLGNAGIMERGWYMPAFIFGYPLPLNFAMWVYRNEDVVREQLKDSLIKCPYQFVAASVLKYIDTGDEDYLAERH